MKGLSKVAAGAMIAATLTTSLAASGTAHASSKGRKNTAIALGAVAVHQLLNGKTTNGILAGAGAAAAYKRYKDSKDSEDRNGRRRARNRNDRDWFDRLTGQNKDTDVRYRRDRNRDDVRYRRDRDRDRVSRRNEDRYRDRYDRTDRYEDDNRYDRYDD